MRPSGCSLQPWLIWQLTRIDGELCLTPFVAVAQHVYTRTPCMGIICGSKVTSITAMPFFFCFVCKHSEGRVRDRHPIVVVDYLYKRPQQDRKEGVSTDVWLHWGPLCFFCVMLRSGPVEVMNRCNCSPVLGMKV